MSTSALHSQPQFHSRPPRPGDLVGRPVLADRARELQHLAWLVREHVLLPSGVEAYDFRYGYVYDRGFRLESFAEAGPYSLDYEEGYWPLERLAAEADPAATLLAARPYVDDGDGNAAPYALATGDARPPMPEPSLENGVLTYRGSPEEDAWYERRRAWYALHATHELEALVRGAALMATVLADYGAGYFTGLGGYEARWSFTRAGVAAETGATGEFEGVVVGEKLRAGWYGWGRG